MNDLINFTTAASSIMVLIFQIIFVVAFVFLAVALVRLTWAKVANLNTDRSTNPGAIKRRRETIKYTQDVVDFIKFVVGQLAVIQFQKLRGKHPLDKVTLSMEHSLIQDVAKAAKSALDEADLVDGTVLTEEFITNLLIDTSTMMIDRLLREAINEAETL